MLSQSSTYPPGSPLPHCSHLPNLLPHFLSRDDGKLPEKRNTNSPISTQATRPPALQSTTPNPSPRASEYIYQRNESLTHEIRFSYTRAATTVVSGLGVGAVIGGAATSSYDFAPAMAGGFSCGVGMALALMGGNALRAAGDIYYHPNNSPLINQPPANLQSPLRTAAQEARIETPQNGKTVKNMICLGLAASAAGGIAAGAPTTACLWEVGLAWAGGLGILAGVINMLLGTAMGMTSPTTSIFKTAPRANPPTNL